MAKKLDSLSAAGVTESDIRLAFQMYEDFCADRALHHVMSSGDFVPWLTQRRGADRDARPPFEDHPRHFVDMNTKRRISTIQPYFMAVARQTNTVVSNEFVKIMEDGKPLPRTFLVFDTLATVLKVAQLASNEFAGKHGLTATVSFNGWYAPERVILIEYTKEAA